MLLGLDAQAGVRHRDGTPAPPERGRAALHDDPRRRDRGGAVRHPVAQAPTSASARFRGPKPAGRFECGRRRGFDDREEFRARDDVRPTSASGLEE